MFRNSLVRDSESFPRKGPVMDQRWHRNHNVQPVRAFARQTSPLVSNAPPPVYPAASTVNQPTIQTGIAGSPTFFPATHASTETQTWMRQALDARDGLIARLQHQLATSQASHQRAMHDISQTASLQFAEEKAAFQHRIADLERASHNDNADVQRVITELRQEVSRLSRLATDRLSNVNSMQQELGNLAAAAAAEQDDLAKQSIHQVRKHQEAIAKKEDMIREMHAESERYRASVAEDMFAQRCKHETLEATVKILRTDHETAELDCSRLESRCDEHEFHLQELQLDLESYIHKIADEQMLSLLALDESREALNSSNQRLAIETAEKQSLIRSTSELRRRAKEHDAQLFAKDQEIDATNKVAHDSQRQLESIRRENESLVSQNDLMRNQIRETTKAISELKQQFSDLEISSAETDARLADRNRQIKDFQSAARASEANVSLQMSDAEHQFALERERIEEQCETERQTWLNDRKRLVFEIDQITQQLEQQKCQSVNPTILSELKSSLNQTQQALNASSAENDRLQTTIDSLNARLVQSDDRAAKERESSQQSSSRLEEVETQLTAKSQQLSNSDLMLQQLRRQAAQYANSISLLQAEIAERDALLNEMPPREDSVKECERLSQELSRRIVSHTQERDALNERIEQLRSETERLQSTQEQLQLNYEQFGADQQRLQQPTETKKAA